MAFEAVTESAQQNASQVAHSAEEAFFKHLERFTVQAGWTKTKIVNYVRTLLVVPMLGFIAGLRGAQLSLNAVRAASSKTLPLWGTRARDERARSNSDGNDANSCGGSTSVGCSSSR